MNGDTYLRGEVHCRSCRSPLQAPVISLGQQPLSNALTDKRNSLQVGTYPLDFRICGSCGLGQIGEFVPPDGIFSEYTYFSSTSTSWLTHSMNFANRMVKQLNLNQNSLVLEVASNDGYLLKFFLEAGINVLGIEPARNVASEAIRQGVDTLVTFFGESVALDLVRVGKIPKLVICNNVLAHVPDINDFVRGLAVFAEHGSLISIEAPSMRVMLEQNLFDTIYHEHFSYLSVLSVQKLFQRYNLTVLSVEFLPTHGGSYRYFVGKNVQQHDHSVEKFLEEEMSYGILDVDTHKDFASRTLSAIQKFRDWCVSSQAPLIGYGAAAKATVLLNAAHLTSSEFAGIADNAKSKQNLYIPGANIPIFDPAQLLKNFTESAMVIFPWNIVEEIVGEVSKNYPHFVGEIWVALPELKRIR